MIINNDTILMGVIGNPIGHSLSPLMHNQAVERLGLNYIYLPFKVDPARLGEAIEAVRALGLRGINVTIPFKEKVIPYLDEISAEAQACGAVNLIKNEQGRLIGFNTDGKGFLASLADEGVSHINRALFIGAGGAARSLAYELAQSGVNRLDFLDIDLAKAQTIASLVSSSTDCLGTSYLMSEELFSDLCKQADLIINCTPLGMFPNQDVPVCSMHNVSSHTVVYDLVYNPLTTRFIAMAQKKQLKTINGVSMLVHQGAIAFEILTGAKPPIALMKEVVLNHLRSR
jgi:shikimate dehydrogenase